MIARCRWVKETIRRRADPDPLAGRRPPDDVAAQHAVAEVQRPLVVLQIGDRQQQRLVVDVELHGLVVRHVHDGLPDAGEAERLLGVPDRPGLVETVDEGAVREGLAALLHVAAHPEVAVADGEQGLGDAEVGRAVARLGQPPLVDREAGAGPADRRSPGCSARPECVIGPPAPPGPRRPGRRRRLSSVSGPTPRSTPTTSPKPPSRPASTPEMASSNDHRPLARRPRAARPRPRRCSGVGLPGRPSRGGERAVDDDREPVGEAGGLEHGRRRCARRRRRRPAVPRAARSPAGRPSPGRGRRPSSPAPRRRRRSCGCPARRPSRRRGRRSGRPRAGDARGTPGTTGRRRSGACRRCSRSSRSPCRAGRRGRAGSGSRRTAARQARMCTSAVGVSTPSRSKSTAS